MRTLHLSVKGQLLEHAAQAADPAVLAAESLKREYFYTLKDHGIDGLAMVIRHAYLASDRAHLDEITAKDTEIQRLNGLVQRLRGLLTPPTTADLVVEVQREVRATGGETGKAIRTVSDRHRLDAGQSGALLSALLMNGIAASCA